MLVFICQFCGSERKNVNALKNHEMRCKENPDRKVQRLGGNKKAWNKGLTKEIDERVAHKVETKKR